MSDALSLIAHNAIVPTHAWVLLGAIWGDLAMGVLIGLTLAGRSPAAR